MSYTAWLARGWNERSCPDWEAIAKRIALYALGSTLIAWMVPTGREMTSVLSAAMQTAVWLGILLFGGARLGGWISRTSWRAWVGGLTRVMGLVLLVPLIDTLAFRLGVTRLAGAWVSPSQAPGWMFGGWTSGGVWSIGVTVALLLGFAWFGWVLVDRASISWRRVVLNLVGAWLGLWALFLVPSMTAWTKLSSYGTTFAPPAQVVEQAFYRVWQPSRWMDIALPRLAFGSETAPRGRFVLLAMSLILLAAVYPRAKRLERGWEGTLLVLAPVIGGGLFTLTKASLTTWPIALLSVVWVVSVLFACSQVLVSGGTKPEEGEASHPVDERFGAGMWWAWLVLAAWVQGGMALPVLLILWGYSTFYESRAWAQQALYVWLLWLFGAWFVMRGAVSALPLLGWVGVGGILAALVAWSSEVTPLSRERVAGLWTAGWALLWMAFFEKSVGMLSIGMIAIGVAGLWLYEISPALRRRIQTAFVILFGILLHSGVFLP